MSFGAIVYQVKISKVFNILEVLGSIPNGFILLKFIVNFSKVSIL